MRSRGGGGQTHFIWEVTTGHTHALIESSLIVVSSDFDAEDRGPDSMLGTLVVSRSSFSAMFATQFVWARRCTSSKEQSAFPGQDSERVRQCFYST